MRLNTKQLNLDTDVTFTGGNLVMGPGKIYLPTGTETLPALSFIEDPNSGFFLTQPGEVALSVGSQVGLYLKEDGSIELPGTTSIAIQGGSTAQRPAQALDGAMRYNFETDRLEIYIQAEWEDIAHLSDFAAYLKIDGSRPMTGNLQMGGHNISGVGTFNGVNITSHASQHNPNASDALATASAVTLTASTTNTTGTANAFARADHTHTITGFQVEDPDLTALAGLTTNGLIARTGNGTAATRTATGTANQIVVTNGDGVLGNPTFALATNPTIPGNITSGTYNGVTVEGHAARHLPGGADALTTASAVGLSATTTSAEGTAASFARSDHTHAIPTAAAVGLSLATTNTVGTSTSLARADHTHVITGVQPLDGDLTALAALASTGIVARTAADTYALRTTTGTTNTITITNGDGVAGNPTITIANNAILPGTAGFTPPSGTTAQRSGTAGQIRYNSDNLRLEAFQSAAWANLVISSDLAAYQPLNGHLTSISGLAANGIIARTAANTVAPRTITGTANQITVTNGDGVSGNPTLSIPTNPTIPGNITSGTYNGVTVEAHASRHAPGGADAIATGVAVGLSATTTNAEGTASSVARSDHTHAIPTAAAVGLSLATTNTAGTSTSLARADHTHVITGVQPLDADLTAIAAFSGTGLAARTAADTWAQRSIAGTATRVAVTNGDGVAGNPTVDLISTGVTPGTYSRVTVDTYGRVTAGAQTTATFHATRLDSPMTTGSWPVKAQAAAYLDPAHPSLTVRGFDDTTPEGVGITMAIPATAAGATITIVGRARSASSGAVAALWNLYTHGYPMGALAPDWGSAITLNPTNIATGNVYPYSVSTSLTLAAMGLTAGQNCQLEIVRNAAAGGDTLVGDFCLFWITVDWN